MKTSTSGLTLSEAFASSLDRLHECIVDLSTSLLYRSTRDGRHKGAVETYQMGLLFMQLSTEIYDDELRIF